MDIFTLLDELNGKVLDIQQIELMKHAYELQQRNIEQLKTNNEIIRENAGLLKEENERLRGQLAQLARDVANGPAEVARPLTDEDIKIVALLVQNDGDVLPLTAIAHETRLGRTVTQFHANRLAQEEYINRIISTAGDGDRFFIRDKGREYAIKNNLLPKSRA